MTFYAKNFAEVVRRVEGVGNIKERQIFRRHVVEPNKNYIAGRGLNFVEVVKNILIAMKITLTLVFDAIRQIVLVEQLLKIRFNRLVERRVDAEIVTRADKVNPVQKIFGLIGSQTFAVFDSHQRMRVIALRGGAVGICRHGRSLYQFMHFRIRVAEFVQRSFDVAAFIGAQNFFHASQTSELFVKFKPAFLSADGRKIRKNQFDLRVSLQKVQQRNFGVSLANELLREFGKRNDFAGKINRLRGEENYRVEVGGINFGNVFDLQRREDGVNGKIYRSGRRVDKTELRGQSLVVAKLNVNLPNERLKSFLGNNQRLANVIFNAILRERVTARETVAKSNCKS